MLMELIDHILDLIASLLHEDRVIEEFRPGGPIVFGSEVLLQEEPQLESSNGPF